MELSETIDSSRFRALDGGHWSLLTYIETRVADFQKTSGRGRINKNHLRTSKTSREQDDWDRLFDLYDLGLIEIEDSNLGIVRLTDYGNLIASDLKKYRARGGTYSDYTLDRFGNAGYEKPVGSITVPLFNFPDCSFYKQVASCWQLRTSPFCTS
jgi:hypothetical protein